MLELKCMSVSSQRTKTWMLRFPLFPLILLLTCLLQSCADIAMTGCQAIYNRHGLQKNFGDQYVTMQAHQNLYIKTDDFKNTHIAIATYNGDLLLAGQVPLAWQKSKAESLVKNIPNVKQVYNLVSVGKPSSTLTRMSDAWITAKIKAKLFASNDVDAGLLKVMTENGTVYLMGTLQPQEASAAVDIAKDTDGVQAVVRIFSYVTISKRNPEEGVKLASKNSAENTAEKAIQPAENQTALTIEPTGNENNAETIAENIPEPDVRGQS